MPVCALCRRIDRNLQSRGLLRGSRGAPRAGKTNLILGLFRQKSMLLKRGVEISSAKP